jgi:C1A family cysteine protease
VIELNEVKRLINTQGLRWDAGETPLAKRFARGDFRGFGFTVKGQEPSGGKGQLTRQGFAFRADERPTTVDWRAVHEKDYVTSVKDQGRCGSCVSFAVCAALESRLRIRQENADLDIRLSVAHLFFCGAGGNGCDAGWQIGKALKRCKEQGVGKEADFPYKDQQVDCKEIQPIVRVPRWRRAQDSSARKQAIYTRGPVIAGMVVHSDLLYYRSGVYRPCTDEQLGLHAVCVIGYDDEEGCWIGKNSWGTAWGAGGFFKIGYGTCGLDAQFDFYDPEVEFIETKN